MTLADISRPALAVAKRNIKLFNRILYHFMVQLVEDPNGMKNRYMFY